MLAFFFPPLLLWHIRMCRDLIKLTALYGVLHGDAFVELLKAKRSSVRSTLRSKDNDVYGFLYPDDSAHALFVAYATAYRHVLDLPRARLETWLREMGFTDIIVDTQSDGIDVGDEDVGPGGLPRKPVATDQVGDMGTCIPVECMKDLIGKKILWKGPTTALKRIMYRVSWCLKERESEEEAKKRVARHKRINWRTFSVVDNITWDLLDVAAGVELSTKQGTVTDDKSGRASSRGGEDMDKIVVEKSYTPNVLSGERRPKSSIFVAEDGTEISGQHVNEHLKIHSMDTATWKEQRDKVKERNSTTNRVADAAVIDNVRRTAV